MADAQEKLAERSRRGDRGAFEELVRCTSRLVYSRIFLQTRDAHRAEDLTQETYLTAWSRIGQLEQPGQFRSWLLSIAHRTCVDAARHEHRKKRSGGRDDSDPDRVESSHADPAESMQKSEQRDRALDALEKLPEEYRQPLMLRYLTGADYDTISRQLAISNGSLRGLLQRGMELLRQRLQEKSK